MLVACGAAAAIFYSRAPLNHDPSFLILATRRWLDGATLYRDIIEISPPMIFYLTAPSVLASQLFGVPASTAFVVFVLAIAGISLVWCWSLLSRVDAIPVAARQFAIVALFAGLVVTPSWEFGQREHLFIILAAPYFIAVAFSPANLRTSAFEKIALGLMAVLGMAIKPFFLAPAVLLALALCWQERDLRPLYDPANLTVWLGDLTYAVFVAVVHPQYLGTIVPMAVLVYTSISSGTPEILDEAALPFFLTLAIVSVGGLSLPLRNSLLALSSVLAGLIIAFIGQLKGWDYHLLPFESMAVFAAVLTAAVSSHDLRTRPLHFAMFAVIPTLLLMRAVYYGPYSNDYADVFVKKFAAIRSDWTGKSILALTTSVPAAFPMINEVGANWAGHYMKTDEN